MNPGDIQKVEALRQRHPRAWKELTTEQKRIALANALNLEKKTLDKAFRLAKKTA
jgi:hypothetical protein